MNVRYLLALAGTGLALGIVTTYGILPSRAEPWGWLAAVAVWAFLAHRWLDGDVFRHVALGGAIAGFVAADVNILFWGEYLANHPEVQQQLIDQEIEGTPRTGFLLAGLFRGLIFGVLLGLPLSWLHRRNAPALASDEEE